MIINTDKNELNFPDLSFHYVVKSYSRHVCFVHF